MDGRSREPRSSIATHLRRWLPGLARGRIPEALPVTLDRRRIYIVPTRTGLGFGLLLATMFAGALNYQNNAALLLTCVLAATLGASMLLTWRALHGLTLRAVHPDHGFCGERLALHLAFADNRRARPGLHAEVDALVQPCPLARVSRDITLTMPTTHRGWTAMPRIRLSNTLPFGLFRTWSWITPAQQVLVYPRALRGVNPPAHHDAPGERTLGGDEFAGLRDYRPGDAMRHIAWKASARRDHLLVREFDRAQPGQPLRLDWNDLADVARETRIAQLAGRVCAAYEATRPWILILEDRHALGPGTDSVHFHRCLTALAELP